MFPSELIVITLEILKRYILIYLNLINKTPTVVILFYLYKNPNAKKLVHSLHSVKLETNINYDLQSSLIR